MPLPSAICLLLHNEKIRDVIDTVTSKAVLILVALPDERKAVLDAIREELRRRDYLPKSASPFPPLNVAIGRCDEIRVRPYVGD